MSVARRLLATCLFLTHCGLVQSIFKQGRVTHFVFSASFFSSASIKDLKDVVTMPSAYLPTGTVFEKLTLPELTEWAHALWDEERVRPRGSGWSWGPLDSPSSVT